MARAREESFLAAALRGEDSATVHAHADAGVAGPGTTLPHLGRIQASFGAHDVSGIRAHVGGAAAGATEAIGARAYATGNQVAFRESPDLHTAAHEAAHVVQQRAGVHLAGGVGKRGDAYERHADAVADQVVRGESAEALLDAMSPGGGGGRVVQRQDEGGRAAPTGSQAAQSEAAPATPEATPEAPGSSIQAIDRELDAARAALLGDHGSVFEQREDAIRNFVTAVLEDDDTASSPDLVEIAAKAALSVVTGFVGGEVTAALAAGGASGIARTFAQFLGAVSSSMADEGVSTAVQGLPRGDISVSQFQDVQIRALSAASRAAATRFDGEHRARFHRAPDGLEQARRLKEAYLAVQEPAFHRQSIATYAQWSEIVRRADGAGDIRERAGTGRRDGVLIISFGMGNGEAHPDWASQGGLSDHARALIRDREGTLGDLQAAGAPLRCILEWQGWRPFFGAVRTTLGCSGGGAVTASGAGPALVAYCNERFGTSLDATDPNAEATAAAVVWTQELDRVTLRQIPEISASPPLIE